MSFREPVVTLVKLIDLRPTQVTVGFHEVEEKRRRFRERSAAAGGAFLGQHRIPTVLGPKDRHYIIDNHHLALALHLEGVEAVLVAATADLSVLKKAAFWRFLDNRNLCHAYDAQGERCDFGDIPDVITDLKDDPYRSLAGDLRHAGGYAKDLTPFSEFLWADFLRGRVKLKTIDKAYGEALALAVNLAKSSEAQHLPGWCGVSAID